MTKGALRAGRRRWILIISMTDEDVVRRCFDLTGVGNFYGPYQSRAKRRDGAPCKPFWVWRVCILEDIVPIAEAMRPWLGQRRGQAVDDLLEYCRTAPPKRLRKAWIDGRCLQGHDLAKEGVYRHPTTGKRQCRGCMRERRSERRARSKAGVLA